MRRKLIYQVDDNRIFPGFYESILFNSDMEHDWNAEEFDALEDHACICEIKDFEGYKNDVSRSICKILKDSISDNIDLCYSFEFNKVKSPREYNFLTDKLIIDIDIDLDLLEVIIQDDNELYNGFSNYLKKNCTSHSGFISFVRNNVEEYFEKSYEDYFNVALDYYIMTKIYEHKDVESDDFDYEESDYYYSLLGIVDETFENYMVPVDD